SQSLLFGRQRLVECGSDLIQGRAEIAPSPCLRAQPSDLVGQSVQTAATVQPPAHQISQGVAYGSCGEHILTDLVDSLAQVERGSEGIWPAAPGAVAETVVGPAGHLIAVLIAPVVI